MHDAANFTMGGTLKTARDPYNGAGPLKRRMGYAPLFMGAITPNFKWQASEMKAIGLLYLLCQRGLLTQKAHAPFSLLA